MDAQAQAQVLPMPWVPTPQRKAKSHQTKIQSYKVANIGKMVVSLFPNALTM